MSRSTRSQDRKSNQISMDDNTGATADASLNDVMAELKKMQTSNEELKARFSSIETALKDHIETSKAATTNLIRDVQKISKALDEQHDTNNDVDQRITKLESRSGVQTNYIAKLELRISQIEEDKRKTNLILDGVVEQDNENVREIVSSLLVDLGVSFGLQDVVNAYRLGQKRDTVTGRPRARPIIMKLKSSDLKAEIYRNISKLKDNLKWKKIYLNDDCSPEVQAQRRDLRCIAALAKSRGIPCKQRGGALVIDGVKYVYKDLHRLPHGLSMETAKVVTVADGIAFQGKHAYLSNLYDCRIQSEGRNYSNVEQLYQATCADICGDPDLATQIRHSVDAYQAKQLAKKIKKTKEWEEKKIKIMEQAIKLKFDQNDNIREKLMSTQGKLYEATTDPVFGCGLTLAQKGRIRSVNINAGNHLGVILEAYRHQQQL